MDNYEVKITENGATVRLFGRVDSTNAPAVESGIDEKIASYDGESFIVDVDGLEYISSAGLRVLLRLRKKYAALKIVNASSEVFEILEMTGFSEMIPVEKAFRKMSVEGCKVIGKGAKGTVYRYNDDTIVKVFHDPDSMGDIRHERELAKKAFVLGIPTAIAFDVVKVGDKYGSVFELLNAESFSQIIAARPEETGKVIEEFAALLRQMHSTRVGPDDMPDAKTLPRKWVALASEELSPEDAKKLTGLTEALPDPMTIVHGDYHTNNVMRQNGEALVIDMDTLSHGHPIVDLANIYCAYVVFSHCDPANVMDFFHFPAETALAIWPLFLKDYLRTDDPKVLDEVEKKTAVLSYSRMLRHTLRRGGKETEEGRKTIAFCKEKLHELLSSVETLDF